MLKYLSTILILASSLEIKSQNYKVEDIPDSLRKNANAVFFLDEASHDIISEKKAVYSVHYVVAIFNDKGEYFSGEQVGYDNNSKVLSFEGKVYDQFGKLIKKTKKSDIYDHSYVKGFSIYDTRIQSIILEQNRFPYIIEFNYKIQYDQTFSIWDRYVNANESVSVLKSKYSITSPNALEPNFKFENTNREFIRNEAGGIVTNSIEFNNLPARKQEDYGPGLSSVTPVIRISPSRFSFENYDGDFSSWESIGKWQLKLNEGRGELSENTIADIKRLAANYQGKDDKIKAIYQYMQDRTRYVSIQLGIGGLQPFPASTVEELGYGDCKALSNYTKSLLGSIGIESYYTWVHGGSNPKKVYADFAYDSFNHIILCVPVENDTIWLECTSQTNPFDYQGDFTGNREALIITPEGGKIVKTTTYEKEDNTQITNATVVVNSLGEAKASINVKYTGLQHENGGINRRVDDGEEKLKKWIYENTDISDFKIIDFSFDYTKSKIPIIEEELDIQINSLGSISGKRMFLVPNLMTKITYIPKQVSNRKSEIILRTAYQHVDTIVYEISSGLHVEHLPEDIVIESDFGKYKAQYKFVDNQLIYIRKMEREKGTYPKELYDEFRNFYKSIVKADKTKVVFVDKT